MKKTITLCTLLLSLVIVNYAFAVTLDGYCYLDGETDHLGSKILFEAVTPSAVTDSTYTNIDGSFSIVLSGGVYTVIYSHDDRLSYTIPYDVEIFNDTTLDNVTLYFGIEGSLSGILNGGYTYQVIENIYVNQDDTLIIEPGATLSFTFPDSGDRYGFFIEGVLFSEGTENDSIVFKSGRETPYPGSWLYILFEDSTSSSSVISYSRIEYFSTGITCSNSSPQILNNKIENGDTGISCHTDSSPIISNNTIKNNSCYGIGCSYSNPIISDNIIDNNNYCGISCSYSSPIISNNSISNNGVGGDLWHSGIKCLFSFSIITSNTIFNNNHNGIYCLVSSPIISYNIIFNNSSDGIYCRDNSSPIINNNTVCNNFNDGIYFYDNSSPDIFNNILYNNYTGINAISSPLAVEYNLFWLNDDAGSGNMPTYFGQVLLVNVNGDSCDTYYNLFMDPLFVNPDSLDFHLTENSPCIDAGNPNPQYNDPDGTRNDMGAYYFDQSIIELTSFTATYDATYRCILICWITAWETDGMGFNIYRNTEDDFEIANQLNFALIPGHGTTTVPHEYEFLDDTADVDSTYYYWLEVLDIGGLTYVYGSTVYEPPVGVDDYNSPNTFCLYQNYPNPFSSSTIISFRLKEISHVKLSIYNVKGQLVKNLLNEDKPAGYHTIECNVKDISSGIYFYKFEAGDKTVIKRMVLMR